MKLTKDELIDFIQEKSAEVYKEATYGSNEELETIRDRLDATEKALEDVKINNPRVAEDNEEDIDEFKGKVAAVKLFKSLATMDLEAQKWLSEYKATFDAGTDNQGGYLVPDAFMADVVEELKKVSVIRPLATVHDVANQGGNQPAITAKVSASRGTEETATTAVTDTFSELSYTLTRVDVNALYSRELELFEKTSEGLYNTLVRHMTEAIDEQDEGDWIEGTGSSEPEGILTKSGISTIDAGTATPSYDNLADAFYGVPARYRKRAAWIVSGAVLGGLRKVTDNDNRPLWIDNIGGDTMRLFGRPVYESEHMTDTDIIVGDISYYHIYEPQKMWVESTREGKTLLSKRQVYIGAWKFNDGQCVLTNPFYIIENIDVS